MSAILQRLTETWGVLWHGTNPIYERAYLAGLRDYPRITAGLGAKSIVQ